MYATSRRVIYVGTFSKTLFPALRLGYLVVPPGLVPVFEKLMSAFAPGVPSNPQAVLADFMDEGHFAAHIRRMRKLYSERHDALLDAARARLAGALDVMPTETGLHTIARLADGFDETDVTERAWARSVTVVPLSRFCLEPVTERGLVLGFSGVRVEEIAKGVGVLADVFDDARRLPLAG